MIKFLIEKEFKQLFRNSFLPKLIFIFPCMIMILMPWAANLEIKTTHQNKDKHEEPHDKHGLLQRGRMIGYDQPEPRHHR